MEPLARVVKSGGTCLNPNFLVQLFTLAFRLPGTAGPDLPRVKRLSDWVMLGKPEMHKWNCAFQCRAGCWKALRYIATKVWLKTHNSKLKVTTDGKFCWRDSDQTHFSWFTFPVIFDQTTHRYFDLCLLLVRCDQDFKILCLCPLTFVLFFSVWIIQLQVQKKGKHFSISNWSKNTGKLCCDVL